MKLGILSKIYRNTGSHGGPNWSEIDKVSDIAVKPTWKEGDGSTRSSRVEKMAKTMLALEITGKIRVSNTDANYIALWQAAHTDDVVDLLVLNGPMNENGVRGYRADFQVFSAPEDQAMNIVLFMDFTLKPAPSDNEPQKVVVSGGAPGYTDITA